MTKKIEYLAESEMSRIADNNAKSFYNMRKEIVKRLQHLASIDDIAKELKHPLEEVAEFEQYYADPTLSEVQEYALLVNSFIDIRIRDYNDEKSSLLDRHLTCERIINEKIANGDFDDIMKIVDEDGSFPVVTMLSDDSLSMLEEHLKPFGGRANVFIFDGDRISYLALDGIGQRKESTGK